MSVSEHLELFLVTAPGLESALADEARAAGFGDTKAVPGGVTVSGGWPEVWRANLELRGAVRVLVRIASFRVLHLAQLDKRARKVDWASVLRADVPVKVEAACRKSKIYHSKAAEERVATAIAETLGAPVSGEAEVVVKVRIEDDLCTVSIDSTGAPLHKRGHKLAVNRAPMRETLAALFLRQCGYEGAETVFDPMCGSGTFVIEAAEMALGLQPGRSRGFAFEQLATFDAAAFAGLRREGPARETGLRFFGSDRDAGAVRMSLENSKRAGVGAITSFAEVGIAKAMPPEGVASGLLILNPPYGQRIGDSRSLTGVYRTIGAALRERFAGWRVGMITSDPKLAAATGLRFGEETPTVDNGGTRVRLYRTGVL